MPRPRSETRGSRCIMPTVRGTVNLVDVERRPGETRISKQLWLWWRGPTAPDLATLWRAYVHRFDLEHTYRVCKQTHTWTTPRIRHPEQADRWTSWCWWPTPRSAWLAARSRSADCHGTSSSALPADVRTSLSNLERLIAKWRAL